MALNADSLTKEIQNSLGYGGEPTSMKNKLFAAAIVAHLKTGIVSFIPGTITGSAPSSGGPVKDAAGKDGKILLVPSTLEVALAAAIGASTPEISKMAQGISGYLMSKGSVEFAAGTLTLVAGNSPSSPGPVVGGGKGGKITKLKGPDMARIVATAIGQPTVSKTLKEMCQAICDHIAKNAEVILPSVVGSATNGGGPIKAAGASGGIIT